MRACAGHIPFIGTPSERARCNATESCNEPLPGAPPYNSKELDFYACMNEFDEGVGTIIALEPVFALIALSVFILVVAVSRYVSLGSILGVLTAMIAFSVSSLAFDGPLPYLWFVLGMGTVIIGMHRDNIKRLLAGTERRIGRSSS